MSRQRMDRLYEHLSGRERALLSLRHTAEGTREPSALRRSMAPGQAPEFNRYIGLANAVWQVLAPVAAVLRQEVEALQLRAMLLRVLVYASGERERAAEALFLHLPEPVTQSEYEARVEQARGEYLPLDEAVEVVADHRELEWETDEEWEQRERAIATEIRAVVREKVLASKGRGRSLAVQQGSLYDWLGAPIPVYGELGLHLEVVPNKHAERVAAQRVAAQREALERTREVLHGDGIDLQALRADAKMPLELRSLQDAAMALAERVRFDYASLHSRLVALETAYAEVKEEFGGDEAATADQRELLHAASAMLSELASEIEPLIGPLPEAARDDAFAAQLERAMELERGH